MLSPVPSERPDWEMDTTVEIEWPDSDEPVDVSASDLAVTSSDSEEDEYDPNVEE
jgi:hypothetical protein